MKNTLNTHSKSVESAAKKGAQVNMFNLRCRVSSKIRIVFAIDSLTGGGAERIISYLANRLNPDKFEIIIILTLGEDIRYELPPNTKVIIIKNQSKSPSIYIRKNFFFRLLAHFIITALQLIYPEKKPQNFSFYKRHTTLFNFISDLNFSAACFSDLIKTIKPNCILSFLPLTNLIALSGKFFYNLKTPIIVSDRNFLSCELKNLKWNGFLSSAMKFLYPKANKYLSNSKISAQDALKNFKIREDQISIIYNGIDLDKIFLESREEINITINRNEIILISAGRLNKQKGFDVLLHALSQVNSKNWRLLLLGEGEEDRNLKNLSFKLKIDEQIHFLSFDPNPWRWFSKANIFVLSSRWEGMPNVIIEAMSLGLPIISTDCPSGPSEILDNGNWGYLVPPESPSDLSNAIDLFISNPVMRSKYSVLSKIRSQDFNLSKMVESYEKLFIETAFLDNGIQLL